jgi:hypothetical protein
VLQKLLLGQRGEVLVHISQSPVLDTHLLMLFSLLLEVRGHGLHMHSVKRLLVLTNGKKGALPGNKLVALVGGATMEKLAVEVVARCELRVVSCAL